MQIQASLDNKHIVVRFPYDALLVARIKRVPGARFVPKDRGGPHWIIPADLASARALREQFGRDLVLSHDLMTWGFRLVNQEKELGSLASADDAELDRLPNVLPALYKTLHTYQRAGAKFIATSPHPLVADQPGLGKTLEVIAGIFEANREAGPNLIVAPLTSLDTVWRYELERWQPYPVFVPSGPRAQRLKVIDEFMKIGGGSWLVINPDMVRFTREKESQYPMLHETTWANIVIDECHKNAIRHPKTLTAQGMFALKVESGGKKIAMSGTPIGGKTINLYGTLHYLNPDVFSSKWRWAEQWLEITDNGFGKVIGGIRKGREVDFYKSLTPYMLRRTKGDVLRELPPKQYVDVWCEMDPSQAKQYKAMVKDAAVRINDTTISVNNVLSEFTRLKQFAFGAQDVHDGKLKPIVHHSGKMDSLMERLDELGILDGEGDEQAVIFSQFKEVVDAVYDALVSHKVPTLKITGDTTKKGERARIQQSFQSGEARVMVMTTTAGGVAITLDRASNVFILDETWDPDDQTQAEDRCHRASRIHQVTVYTFRTRGTVEEYILGVLLGKKDVNEAIMDRRRDLLKV